MTTVVIYPSEDGYIQGTTATSYAVARATSTSADTTSASADVGQRKAGPIWSVRRAYLFFDTTVANIPADAEIVSATLYLCASLDGSTTDFEIQVRRQDWESPLDDAGLRETNYDDALATALDVVFRNTSSGWTVDTYYNAAVTIGNIDRDNGTKYVIVSKEDIDNSAPADDEYVSFYASEQSGSDKDPYLEVVYTIPGQPASVRSSGVPFMRSPGQGGARLGG